MADHRDGPRLINTIFPVFQQLPSRQQVILTQLLGVAPAGVVVDRLHHDAASLAAQFRHTER